MSNFSFERRSNVGLVNIQMNDSPGSVTLGLRPGLISPIRLISVPVGIFPPAKSFNVRIRISERDRRYPSGLKTHGHRAHWRYFLKQALGVTSSMFRSQNQNHPPLFSAGSLRKVIGIFRTLLIMAFSVGLFFPRPGQSPLCRNRGFRVIGSKC